MRLRCFLEVLRCVFYGFRVSGRFQMVLMILRCFLEVFKLFPCGFKVFPDDFEVFLALRCALSLVLGCFRVFQTSAAENKRFD